LQPYLDNLDRLLFNYLASGYSMSASAWKIRDRVGGDLVFPDYAARNPYTKPGLTSFVFELRHVAQHDRVTVSAARISMERLEGEIGFKDGPDFFLSLEQLRWLRYKSAEKAAFLETLTTDLSLGTIIAGFTPELLTFIDWFIGELITVAGGQ
jgi:hypothetical protein